MQTKISIMKSLFTKLCKVFFLLRLCIISGFAQSKVDTIFLNDLGIANVNNISSFGKDLYFRRNDSLYLILNNKPKFESIVNKNYSEVFYNTDLNKISIRNIDFIKLLKSVNRSILPGRITSTLSEARIGNNYYLCYNKRILKYYINDFYSTNFEGSSFRSIAFLNNKFIFGTYNGVFKSTIKYTDIEKIDNISYLNGEINNINGITFLNQDELKILDKSGKNAITINFAKDGDLYRKIVYFKNNYYALKTHGIEKFNLNPKYKKIQYFKFSSKPTDLEINGNLYYSTENGEIGTFNNIKKIVNSKIIDFDIINDKIYLATEHEFLILKKSDFSILIRVKTNKRIYEIATNNEFTLILTNDGLDILHKNKLYNIIPLVEFNNRAVLINNSMAYLGSINGLITLDLNYLKNHLIPELNYTEIKNLEIQNSNNNIIYMYLIFIICLGIIFYLRKRRGNNTEYQNQEKKLFDLENIKLLFFQEKVKNVNEIASYYNISRVTLNKKFKEFNITPIEFTKKIKTDLVLNYYFKEKLSKDQIAQKSGYSKVMISKIIKNQDNINNENFKK